MWLNLILQVRCKQQVLKKIPTLLYVLKNCTSKKSVLAGTFTHTNNHNINKLKPNLSQTFYALKIYCTYKILREGEVCFATFWAVHTENTIED